MVTPFSEDYVIPAAAVSPTDPDRMNNASWGTQALRERDVRRTLSVWRRPEVLYAKTGDVSIAYSVVGDAPSELVEGKLGGIAVHIGARVAKEAARGEVLVRAP